MQFLARLLDHILEERSARTTVIVATSGDTGAAAAEAFRGRRAIDLVILYPHGRISEVQRRQMTTVPDDNVHALAIEGTFDDCQALVKAMFLDEGLRRDLDLSGVNSINWARSVAQITYYCVAAAALGAPHRKVVFSVPTGTFGDIYAGYAARRMGLPVDRLIIATNTTDILHRMLATGRYAKGEVTPTASPSMDIQVASNFERLLYEAAGRDAGAVRVMMQALAADGAFALPAPALAAIRDSFASGAVSEAETTATIAATHAATGLIVDPHTAVGIAAARRAGAGAGDGDEATPVVTLATAHPAKFPDAVGAACGVRPALPARFEGILQAPERSRRLPADLSAVAAAVRAASRTRAGAAA
jgi:threonine synthase